MKVSKEKGSLNDYGKNPSFFGTLKFRNGFDGDKVIILVGERTDRWGKDAIFFHSTEDASEATIDDSFLRKYLDNYTVEVNWYFGDSSVRALTMVTFIVRDESGKVVDKACFDTDERLS